MKRLLLILGFMISMAAYSQVSDATMRTYTDTYINTNGTGSITGAMLNTDLNYLIDSKVNKDSATTVRIATTKDSLFITYYGFPEDTIVLNLTADTALWGSDGSTKIYTLPATDYVGIGTDNPMTKLHLVDSVGSLGINPYVYSTTATHRGQLNFGKFNGSPSSYAAIASGTTIGSIGFAASYNTSSSAFMAQMYVSSSELWSATERGNEMIFKTCENGASVEDVSMKIDSNANIIVPRGDVVVAGGYSAWTPTMVWTGGTPTTATINSTRYSYINRTVTFMIDIEGTNDSGTTLTAINFTAPETVKDIDAYVPCVAYYAAAKSTPTTSVVAFIDAETNLKIYVTGLNIANSSDYRLFISGFYEIDGK